MKNIFVCLTLLFFALGCAHGSHKALPQAKKKKPDFVKKIETESENIAKSRKNLKAALEKKAVKKIRLSPVMPAYDPLEDQIVSFSMVDEKLQTILYTLAQSTGMNLIIDPSINLEDKRVTLNFEKVSAASVLRELLGIYDVYYEIDENIIRVRPFQTRLFKLNFLNSEVATNFDVGGDVLGAGDTSSSSGLSGSFKLSGKNIQKGNPYDIIDGMMKRLKSKNGTYALNRLAGTLFVKDTPDSMRSISRVVEHFKDIQSRQIEIDARIIEVTLSDKYKYGIDWSVVRDTTASSAAYTSAGWSMGKGLVISHRNADISINPLGEAVNALKTFGKTKVVSNPSIRCKHGKPAMISVGTSYSYKKSVTNTTTTSTSSTPTTETEVEVSTVFDGLILGVVPFIQENGSMTLLINPIKSDVDQNSLELQSVGSSSNESISLPKVNVKEISTTIAMNDGDVVMLGGLIDKSKISDNSGVPLISSIPLLGHLFKNEFQSSETRELVIILSATIL